jgi:quercetin dioxygenase-like cupin family protein
MTVIFNNFDQTEWVDELAKAKVDPEVARAAMAAGAKRKMLASGETGLFVQYSDLPANYRIDPHTHSRGEVIVVLGGSCTVDGGNEMGTNDTVCIGADTRYGLTCGPDGMRMLTIRAGDSVVNFKS